MGGDPPYQLDTGGIPKSVILVADWKEIQVAYQLQVGLTAYRRGAVGGRIGNDVRVYHSAPKYGHSIYSDTNYPGYLHRYGEYGGFEGTNTVVGAGRY